MKIYQISSDFVPLFRTFRTLKKLSNLVDFESLLKILSKMAGFDRKTAEVAKASKV